MNPGFAAGLHDFFDFSLAIAHFFPGRRRGFGGGYVAASVGLGLVAACGAGMSWRAAICWAFDSPEHGAGWPGSATHVINGSARLAIINATAIREGGEGESFLAALHVGCQL